MNALTSLPNGIRKVVGPITPETHTAITGQLRYDAERRPDRSRIEAATSYASSEVHFLAHAALTSAPIDDYPERIAWEAVGYYREALWLGASS